MAAASDYLEAGLLEHFRGTQLPLPTAYFIALHTSDPTDIGDAATEIQLTAWPAYTRQSLGIPLDTAWSVSTDEAGGGKQIANTNTLNFPANDGTGSITVSHFSVWDAETGGNMWAHAPLVAAKTIDPTDIFSAASGALTIIAR